MGAAGSSMEGGPAAAMDLDDQAPQTTWERNTKRVWDDVEEGTDGRIEVHAKDDAIEAHRQRRKKLESSVVTQANIRKGLIRYLVVVVELSRRGMTVGDDVFRPNRAAAVSALLPQFFKDFFDLNPISQLAVVVTRNKTAEKLTDFTGSARKHIAAVKEHVAGAPFQSGGDPSLQNALLMANDMLSTIPQYGVREVLVLWGALTTVDPDDIFGTVATLQKSQVRCSVISMSAEMYVCKHLSSETNGESSVARDLPHLKELVMSNTAPAATLRRPGDVKDPEAYLIVMGFPCSVSERHTAFCACHQEVKGAGYLCPRCLSKMCELPSQCKVCGLSLMSSSHLARSYHHLFPVSRFNEQTTAAITASPASSHCAGCQKVTQAEHQLECPKCKSKFCFECDAFIHDCLHVCPG